MPNPNLWKFILKSLSWKLKTIKIFGKFLKSTNLKIKSFSDVNLLIVQSVGGETTKSHWTREERYSTFGDFRQNRKKENLKTGSNWKFLGLGIKLVLVGFYWVFVEVSGFWWNFGFLIGFGSSFRGFSYFQAFIGYCEIIQLDFGKHFGFLAGFGIWGSFWW